jgi:hypothetical protein
METRIVPLKMAKQEIAACKVVRRLPRYRDYFAPAESWDACGGFALLRAPALPEGAPTLAGILRAVQALQRLSLVHRNLGPAAVRGGVLSDFSAAVDVRTAFAQAREVFFAVDGPTAPDLQLLVAAQHGPLTRQIVEEVCTKEGAKFYEKYVGAPPAAVVRGLLAGWRTWDLYAVAHLFPGRLPQSLHCDAAQRPSVAACLLTAA